MMSRGNRERDESIGLGAGVSESHDRPKELHFPYDPLRMAALMAFLLHSAGQGVAFLEAALTSDPAIVIRSGIVARNGAIGALTGASLGVAYPVVYWLYLCAYHYRRAGHDNLNDRTSRRVEHKRSPYMLSTQSLNPFDMRIFMTSQALAVFLAVLLPNMGNAELKLFGDLVGRNVGSLVGLVGLPLWPKLIRSLENRFIHVGQRALRSQPRLLRYFENGFVRRRIATRSDKKWYQLSRHDNPFYVRLFTLGVSGYLVMLSLSTANEYTDTFNQQRFIATLVGCKIAFFLPDVQYFSDQLQSFLGRLQGRPAHRDVRFKRAAWYTNTLDIPFYVRIFAGVVWSATVVSVRANYYQTDQNSQNNHIITYLGIIAPWVFPVVSEMMERFLRYCRPNYFVMEPEPPRVNLARDMPCYGRLAISAVAGSMLGSALYYATTDAASYDFESPPSNLPLIAMWIMMILAFITPALMTGIDKCRSRYNILNSTQEDQDDLRLPWYARILMGLMLGALVGSSGDYFLEDTSEIPIIPGFIGPEFLGIANACGAAIPALVFALLGLLWPVGEFVGRKVKKRISSRQVCLFQYHEPAEVEQEGEEERVRLQT